MSIGCLERNKHTDQSRTFDLLAAPTSESDGSHEDGVHLFPIQQQWRAPLRSIAVVYVVHCDAGFTFQSKTNEHGGTEQGV